MRTRSALVLILLAPLLTILAPSAQAAACSTSIQTISNTRYVKITSGNSCTWTVPSGVTAIDYVIVGGGSGGGGGGYNLGGGGGGASGVVLTSTGYSVTAGNTLTIKVGTGGSAGLSDTSTPTSGGAGDSTTLTYLGSTITAGGGGGGGRASVASTQSDLSGDGGSNANYSGGISVWDGGGGGAGAAGNGSDGQDIGGQGGTGGPGGTGATSALINDIAAATSSGQLNGSNYYFGGGGGAGSTPAGNGNPPTGSNTGVGAAGGLGGGGNGGFSTSGASATDGLANSGSGGGGGGWKSDATVVQRNGGAGAAGIVLIRFSGFIDTILVNSISLPAASTYRSNVTTGFSLNISAKVTYFIREKRIPGCINLPATGSGASYTSTCTFKPSLIGSSLIRATIKPTDGVLQSISTNLGVTNSAARAGKR